MQEGWEISLAAGQARPARLPSNKETASHQLPDRLLPALRHLKDFKQMTGKIIKKKKKEGWGGGEGERKKNNPLTPTTGTISALITHPKLGSLELNLHFKHDFKNTLLCFPRRKYWALAGKSYSACWKQSPGSVPVPTGPACPRWELREGQIWLSPRLQQAAVCAPHFPGADTFHVCHS